MTTKTTVPNLFDPAGLLQAMNAWQSLAQGWQGTYNEPILPGWTINVDSFNSASPETERDVLKVASYGRQIGRLADAVAELVKRDAGPSCEAFEELQELRDEVDAVKERARAKRVVRMTGDLVALKASDPKQFARVKAALLAVL